MNVLLPSANFNKKSIKTLDIKCCCSLQLTYLGKSPFSAVLEHRFPTDRNCGFCFAGMVLVFHRTFSFLTNQML